MVLCRCGVRIKKKSRVSDQNGVFLLYIMLEIHHSAREPSVGYRTKTRTAENTKQSIRASKQHGRFVLAFFYSQIF